MSGASGSKFASQTEKEEIKQHTPLPIDPFIFPQPTFPVRVCCVCGQNNGNKMKCGHFICPEDLLDNTWSQINSNKHNISCAQCTAIIDVNEIFKFVNINDGEKNSITKALSNNLAISEGKVSCPSCGNYCQRQTLCQTQVICESCPKVGYKPYVFCFNCSGKWKDSSNCRDCGNKSCRKIRMSAIINSPKINFTQNETVIKVPQIRMCPSCSTIIELKSGCSQMVCRICGFKFCFICLRKLTGTGEICRTETYNNSITCKRAPIQKI